MARKYIKVFFDWPDTTAALTTEEKGQLIDALIAYAAGMPYEVTGNVAVLMPVFKRQIDRDNETYQKKVDNGKYGKLGGRPTKSLQENPQGFTETHNEAEKPIGLENNPMPPTANENNLMACKTKNKDYKTEDQDYDKDNISTSSPSLPDGNPFADDDGAKPSFDTIQVYAGNSLRSVSPGNLKAINDYVSEMGEPLVRYAIDAACANGAPTWRYAEKILIRLKEQGITTVADAKASDEKFRHSRDRPNEDDDDEGGSSRWVW